VVPKARRFRLTISNPILKAPLVSAICNQRLKFECRELLSIVAYKFNLRRYTKGDFAWDGSGRGGVGESDADRAMAAGLPKEDDCWLLGMVSDHSAAGGGRSTLVILDGGD